MEPGEYRSVIWQHYEAANERRAGAVLQLELPGVSGVGTLRESCNWFLANCMDGLAIKTQEMHTAHCRYFCDFFGDAKSIKAIRYAELKRYKQSEEKRGCALETIRKRLGTLHQVLEEATRRELPQLIATLPPWISIKTDTRRKESFWTLAQYEAARAACDDDLDMRTWVDIGFWCGSHSSDINRFRWGDVNLWKKTWTRRNTKSKAEPIDLPLPDRLHKILLERHTLLQPHPRDLITGRNLGHPHRPIKALALRADVPSISPIGLRHSCGTFLEESGAPPAFIQNWFGHKSVKTYRKHYVHLSEQMVADGMAALERGAAKSG